MSAEHAQSAPKVLIIAGPNGAEKTTFARAFLPKEANLTRFINADLIAAGLSPFAPEAAAIKAGRVMLNEIATCAARGDSFAFETTCRAWATCATFLYGGRPVTTSACFSWPCQTQNWPSPAWRCACDKAATTFPKTISRRFQTGRKNFVQHYRDAVDAWALNDNAGEEPILIEWGEAP